MILTFILLSSGLSQADLIVVANKNNEVKTLTKKQVIDIYMGRTSEFPNGEPALPIDQHVDSPTRKSFYQHLVHKTVSEINAYWARLLFSGRASPPRTVKDATSVINIIKKNASAIGYIQLKDLTDDLQVVNYVE